MCCTAKVTRVHRSIYQLNRMTILFIIDLRCGLSLCHTLSIYNNNSPFVRAMSSANYIGKGAKTSRTQIAAGH